MGGLSREVILVNELGLHARAAAKIAEVARRAQGRVWVQRGAETADATRIMDILTLACEKGARLTLGVDDPADGAVLAALVLLVADGFEE